MALPVCEPGRPQARRPPTGVYRPFQGVITIDDESALPPRYENAERVADGGMSEVFRVTDGVLGRTVAVKLLATRFQSDPAARSRFAREARAAARLSNEPHTVTVFDIGEWRDRPYIVMEYLPGGSLADLLRRGKPIPAERSLAWLEQAAFALDHAHAHGVIHRDVKPANLLLDDRDNVLVADFGIATAAGLESVTLTGTVLGTAGYLAPEQAAGRQATPASDRYGLAVVAYELLAGERPFARGTVVAEIIAQAHDPVASISAHNPQLPGAADSVFARALDPDPAKRFGSCAVFVRALAGALTGPLEDGEAAPTLLLPPTSAAPAGASLRRWGIPVAMLAGAGVLVAIALSVGDRAAAPPTRPAAVAGEASLPSAKSASTTTTLSATTVSAPPAGPAQLIAQGERFLSEGKPLQALPLLQQANRDLNGSGSADEGRADAALAAAIVGVSSCNGVASLVVRADQLLGPQPATDRLAADCQPPGAGAGRDQGNGHGDGGGNGPGVHG